MQAEGIGDLRTAEDLRRIEIFSEATVDQLFQLARLAREVEFARGASIFREGDAAEAFYLVESGQVQVEASDGNRRTIGPGGCFGLHGALRREPRGASAAAVEPTAALAIEAEDVYTVLSENTDMLARVVRRLAQLCLQCCD